ncbi:lipopolysaccharide heptosyltransferase II [Candidatus Woesearchaeota archaeon]|nr:lipopolysaccharide heptosyltransferase II [Candidatus Woesearchaeota archaeon]
MKKILFFRLGALGDVLMTTPLVKAVKKKYPKVQIDYWTATSFASVLKNNKYIDKVKVFDENLFYKKKPLAMLQLAKKLRREKYDVAFVLDKHWIFSLMIKLTGIKKRIGFSRTKEGLFNTHNVGYNQKKHDILTYLELAKFVGVKNSDVQMDLAISKKALGFASAQLKKYKLVKPVCVIPGGAKNPGQELKIKRMPKEKFSELINELTKKYDLLLLGGPSDVSINKRVLSRVSPIKKVVDLAGKTTIEESAALIKNCRLVICNDSGPMHMACAVNDKVLAIFGPTNPLVLRPLNKGSDYFWAAKKPVYDIYGKLKESKNLWQKVSVAQILAKVQKMLR